MDANFQVTMRMTQWFVDRPAIKRAIAASGTRSLPRIGAFLRRRARSMLRRRKRVSEPGERPSVHSTDDIASLKNIRFAVDPYAIKVLCGPVKLNQRQMVADVGSQTVPEIMEFGGVVSIQEQGRADGKPWADGTLWRRRDLRRNPRPWERYRVRRAVYQPRPFMGPALSEEIAAGTIPQTLSGTVRAS